MSPIPELQQRQIDRWCERRVPADKRIMSRWRGRMVTLVEKRPDWSGAALEERAFAQLRYGVDGMWTLYYWSEDLGRWRKYPQSVRENSPVQLLAAIDRSASDGYFFTLQT
ncbi:DUF3024 domain-containing protein [Amycolatopsis acidiphila]|uniref:DUF3024 domain-containing protein n=1 Tax=Amycolatopsis acidiphila TaxID=715473 RepID=A0A558AMQ4_9PSEU|nr:DUF3024 domain-containing protein [Amycolatopsis acidiphila]TVT25511.1 hypothetical protein FNH06_01465 [Amycolatopsis acidiphila]UIJ60253.1 DUF3024 domain-containing protein [Amycolatopsis acidiphila]GHG60489.1 hypothetical protein GCM10017788_14260 [Amycolatopsis acidiphila]